MNSADLFVVAVVAVVYLGMALGRFPGLALDRTGIALLGALALYSGGALDGRTALAAIDFPTLVILFGLMVLSAQFVVSGFYDRIAQRIAQTRLAPAGLLALVVAVTGVLSAVLANDIVCFAMTPVLCQGLMRRGLDPRPFLIALAGAANAGSAATLIGNPQNVLIGQVGALDFWHFLRLCAVPAALALGAVHLAVWLSWRRRFALAPGASVPIAVPRPYDRPGTIKGAFAVLLLLGLFAVPVPQADGVLIVAALLLLSRRNATRPMLGVIDWNLLLLFAGLFVVLAALTASDLPARLLPEAIVSGAGLDELSWLLPVAVVGSNTIGNVPFVVLLLSTLSGWSPESLIALALLSTLAGNLLLVGSFANLITAERAAAVGVRLGFLDHARCGVPMTLLGLAAAAGWLWAAGLMRF